MAHAWAGKRCSVEDGLTSKCVRWRQQLQSGGLVTDCLEGRRSIGLCKSYQGEMNGEHAIVTSAVNNSRQQK